MRKHLIIRRESENELKPNLLYAGELSFTKNWSEEPHSHPFCELLFVTEGSGETEVDGQVFPVKAGDLVLYNAGARHAERTEEGFAFLFFAVRNLKFSRAADDRPLDACMPPVLPSGEFRKEFSALFGMLVREARERRRFGNEVCKGLANAVLGLYLRLLPVEEGKYLSPNETYLRAKAYIDEHYLSLGKVEELCVALRVSRYYLTHLFRTYCGISPLQYALCRRMEHAKRLLAETDLSVEKIASEVGYLEAGSFIRAFRIKEGVTPAVYRRTRS